MTSHDDKAVIEHIDATDRSSNTGSDAIHPVHTVDSTNEAIIRELETSGEKIGLTTRSILAACVSTTIILGLS